MEFLLYNKDLDFNKFKKAIEKQYQFLTVTKENGTVMIRGLVESAYQIVFFNQNLLNACKDIIYLIDRSEDFYYINGKKSTLYDLMYLFRTYEPKNLTRYKGLGKLFAPVLKKFNADNLSNCWERLKLSCLLRNRKIETSREMNYAEIKAINVLIVLRFVNNV